jgi:hypothetical protein
MSISEAKLQANRENAQKSSGPRSAFGRARAAQNAMKHGLCSAFCVLESESQEEYNDLLQRFINTEKPADDVENELVARMARETWMSERAVRCQSGCFVHEPQSKELWAESKQAITVKFRELEKFTRYQTAHDRAYDRAAAALAKHRKERLAEQRGFVSQQRAEAAEVRKEKQEARREKREKQSDELFEIQKSREIIRRDLDQFRFYDKLGPEVVKEMLHAAA